MMITPQITFRHIEPSPAVEATIRGEVEALDQIFDRITSCRVVVDAPVPQQHHGKGFRISVRLGVPGSEIVVNHEPSLHRALVQSETAEVEKAMEAGPERKDIYVVIADTFAAARRQLEDYVRVRRGEVKGRAAVSAAGVEA